MHSLSRLWCPSTIICFTYYNFFNCYYHTVVFLILCSTFPFQMSDLESELERRTLTYTEWNLSVTKMEREGWHPITFSYANAGPQRIKQIKVFFYALLLCDWFIENPTIFKLSEMFVCLFVYLCYFGAGSVGEMIVHPLCLFQNSLYHSTPRVFSYRLLFPLNRISTMFTMRLSSGQSGVEPIQHLFHVSYSQGSSLEELQCAFWVREWLAPLT